MKYMISWKIACENHKSAGLGFLRSGAPAPEGLEILGRWHGPGSINGWALAETDDPKALYEHAAEWGAFLEMAVTPVLEDVDAAEALSKVYSE